MKIQGEPFLMVTIPKMSDREIISWVDEKSFGRGKRYFENGTIFDARKVGMTLKANCEGSRAAIFRRSRHEWHGELSLAHELSAIKKIGEKFAETKDYSSAYAVYAGVSSSVIENLEIFHDEEGYLNEVVQECVNGLGLCLKNEKNGNIREKILNSIFKIFASDIDDFGGIGLSDEIPELVVQHTTDNERKMVIDWIRHKMSKANGWSHEVYIEFLQDLEK